MPHVSGWPWNFVEEVTSRIEPHFGPPDYTIITRPVRHMDPHRTISLFPVELVDPPNSRVIGQHEPILNRYAYRVQVFSKVATEAEGRAINALDSKMLQVVLYRDPDLSASLPTLTEDILGTVERFMRWGISRTSYLNNQVDASFMFLAQTELWVETEQVQT